MKLFGEGDLWSVLNAQKGKIRQDIESQNQNYLLNANETQLIAHITEKYRLDPIILNEEGVYLTDKEKMIPAEQFDSFRFHVRPGESYRKQVVTFHLPFSGDRDLFKYMPSTRILWTQDVAIQNGEICFEGIIWSDGDVAAVKRNWEDFLRSLKTQIGYSTNEVNAHNSSLETEVTVAIQQRKADFLKKGNVLASLGIPLKRSVNLPTTFAVPAPKKNVLIAKPTASTAAFTPEPTLDSKTYEDILKIIHDTGVEIERHPSIYAGKDEETLRDHLLMVLSPHFSSVTGETFNKAGKTDVLIRHEGKNLFVAECGVWKGAKQFLGKIDQLLSYLTWRDSKTALISFVRNKEFGVVMQSIKTEIRTHPCFVKEYPSINEGWLRYEFTMKDDPSRSVKLAVLCFHFP